MIARGLYVALFVASAANAGICDKLEFAEMDAMARDDLLALRCQYSADMLELAGKTANQSIGTALSLTAAANRCAGESTRMDRILARKFASKAKGDDLIVEMNRRCQK